MSKNLRTVILGTGSEIPERIIDNDYFIRGDKFYGSDGQEIEKDLGKFTKVSGIKERRYADDKDVASDLGYRAGLKALEISGVDPETLDFIIFAHNFGDIDTTYIRTNLVPELSMKVKGMLKIKNRKTETRDVPFGCPGWVQGLIDANRFFRAGDGTRALVIGAETLSRVKDKSDRDGPLYSDGGGAVVVQFMESDGGILSYAVDCGDTTEKAGKERSKSPYQIMGMGPTYGPDKDERLYFKMKDGTDVADYAKKYVPPIIQEAILKAGLTLKDLKKLFLHQANGKMDESMFMETLKLFGIHPIREIDKKNDLVLFYSDREPLQQNLHPDVFGSLESSFGVKERYELGEISSFMMPMTISWLANSSVATVPTLFDLVLRGKLEGHALNPRDNVVLVSIGAGGPNINSIVYRMTGLENCKIAS
jgi:3-oxoacyl-[acyl-carrier-protein] synthase III